MGVFLNQKPVEPIPSVPVASFLESSIEELEVPVYNETGKVITDSLNSSICIGSNAWSNLRPNITL